MKHRSTPIISRPLSGRFGKLICLLLVSPIASTAWAEKIEFVADQIVLNPGETTLLQACISQETLQYVKSNIWPGAPIQMNFTWSTFPVNNKHEKGMTYSPWPGQTATLPQKAEIAGPMGDGRYCTHTVVSWKDFPATGGWMVNAVIPQPIGIFGGRMFNIKPGANKPATGTKAKSVSLTTVTPSAGNAKGMGTGRGGGFAPLSPYAGILVQRQAAQNPALQNGTNKPPRLSPGQQGVANPRLNPQPEVPSPHLGTGLIKPPQPMLQPRTNNPTLTRAPGKPAANQAPKPSSAPPARSGTTAIIHLPVAPAARIQNAPGPPDIPARDN